MCAAVEEGVVADGSVILFRARSAIDTWTVSSAEQQADARIVYTAPVASMFRITANAGTGAQAVIHQVLSGEESHGYDAVSDRYGDMLELGVVDLAKVVRTILRNAVSTAALSSIMDCMIADVRESYVGRPDEISNLAMFNAGYA